MAQTVDQLLAGTHPISAVVPPVRNKLTFHWDPGSIGEWIDHYHKTDVLWFRRREGTSNSDTLSRRR